MWEVTWGYGFEDRNGGATIFDMNSYGGLTDLNGEGVPQYMIDHGSWRWLYPRGPVVDRTYTYTFADGTVWTAEVTRLATGCPQIVWDNNLPA